MKKIIITLALALAATTSAFAQFSVGAGYVNSSNKTTISSTESVKNANGFYVGGDMTFELGSGFVVMPGVYYSMTMSKGDVLGVADTQTDNHSIAVPVRFAYGAHIADPVRMFVFAGPQINLGLASTTKTKVMNTTTSFNNYSEDGDISRFNLAATVGIGFDIVETVRLTFGYNWGLLDLHKEENVKLTNTNWQIGAAFLF